MNHSKVLFRVRSSLAIIGVAVLYSIFLFPLYYFFPQYTPYILAGTVVLIIANIVHTSISLAIQNRNTDFLEDEKINRYLEDEINIVAQELEISTPKIKITPSRMMNASAMGITQYTSQVHVTSELINNSTQEELRSTLAHEASHIKNRDIFIMYILYSPYKIIQKTHNLLIDLYSREDTAVKFAFIPFITVTYVLSYSVLILIRLVSRQREFLADMKGAEITSPETEVQKLRKIEKYNSQIQKQLKSEEVTELMQQFPINVSDQIFSTHPRTENRVKNIHSRFFD